MECACTAEYDSSNAYEITPIYREVVNAFKPTQCGECDRPIPIGEEYIREVNLVDYGLLGNSTELFNICEHCYSVRQVFFSNGWVYGNIWSDVSKLVETYDGDLSVSCIRQLTPLARNKLLDIQQQYYIDADDYCPMCDNVLIERWSMLECPACGNIEPCI